MNSNKPPKRIAPPLNEERLRGLALHYAGRYATTKAKLATYLNRKLHERGWDGDRPADIESLIENFAELGYVDDVGFANARSRAFVRRGYGTRRLSQDLNAAGISPTDSADAMNDALNATWIAAENFARRKRIGPFATTKADPDTQQKQLQAFARAGHAWEYARRFVMADPGEFPECDI